MHKDDCIWTEPNRCNCGWLQDIAKNPCEAVREIDRLRAELAEAQTVKESLIVALDLFGRHSPKGKPCPVCEAIDAAMAGGEQ